MSFNQWYTNYKKISYEWRAKNFLPILKLMARLKIVPHQITLFRLVFVFPLAFFFYYNNLWGVLIFYLLFWLLDLFDGSLARYLKMESDKGRFVDSIVDNFMYCFVILGFIYLQAASVYLLAYNCVIEIFVQLLATIKKRGKEKSDWLINTSPDIPQFKSISHLALILFLAGFNILNPVYLLLNTVMTVLGLYYLLVIIKD